MFTQKLFEGYMQQEIEKIRQKYLQQRETPEKEK